MKAVTVKSKDPCPELSEPVKDCIRKECEYKKTFEDRNEDYIKLNMGIE